MGAACPALVLTGVLALITTGCAAEATNGPVGVVVSSAAAPSGAAPRAGDGGDLPRPGTTAKPSASPANEPFSRSQTGPAGQRLIASASWVRRGGQRSLAVEPSAQLRANASLGLGEEAWRQLMVAVPTANTAGMREQFVCHVLFASTKARFYLEPWRPARSLAATILEGCNPGPRKDLG